jgi:folylpolyglutamate synthase/dihydropteroate synthase
MKNFHATIVFTAKSDKAAQGLLEQLQRLVDGVNSDQIEGINLDIQEEIVFTRRDTDKTDDEVIAGLSFDEIFVPKSDSF